MKRWVKTTLTALMLAGFIPASQGCDHLLKYGCRIAEWPEIEHQKQLRAKLPKPTPLIDPYRKPEPHINPGPAITPDKFDAADRPGLQLMSSKNPNP